MSSCGHDAMLGLMLGGKSSRLQESEKKADATLFLVDTLVNDNFEAPAPLCFENLLRKLLRHMPQAVVFAQLTRPPIERSLGSTTWQHEQIKILEEGILQHYRLPYVDSTLFLQGHLDLWNRQQPYSSHPTWYGHQLLADRIASLWGSLWNSACGEAAPVDAGVPRSFLPRQSFFSSENLRQVAACDAPLTAYSAYASSRGDLHSA